MGSIHPSVWDSHLSRHTKEEVFLRPFLNGFDITWGRRRTARNQELSVFFLRPEKFMAETFGFSQEVLLVFSDYPTLEARTVLAAEQFLNDDPGKGRLERLTYFLVSSMTETDPTEWIRSYIAANHESRLIVAFSTRELAEKRGDPWYIRNCISQQLFSRDMFDFRLPLENDTYFFGRQALLMDYLDAARRGENRGLFGLRKTGKTSFLFKLRRSLREQDILTLYYDCKSPSVRQLNWNELLNDISEEIASSLKREFQAPSDLRRFAAEFNKLLALLPANNRVALIFDEIEYISPYAQQDQHWHKEYIPFWQTIWAAQSQLRNLFVVLAGVNPSLVEVDKIEQIQNPLFGIVPPRYLQGLGIDEVRTMLRTLGRRMGLNFSESAVDYIHSRYGGHPLLTRLACSEIHHQHSLSKTERPISIEDMELRDKENQRDAELAFYCGHVVSELRDFYPDEYDMLELLSSGRVQDFMELAIYPEYFNHLRYYGLIREDQSGTPELAIPVVGRYVALEEAKRQGRKTILRVVPNEERQTWLKRRLGQILTAISELERLVGLAKLPCLYGPNSVPQSHKLLEQSAVNSTGAFNNFITVYNSCFVEGIENYARHLGKKNYFWKEIKKAYPSLFEALHRIKVYRHKNSHITLKPEVEKNYKEFLYRDLEGRDLNTVDDVWFVLQQCVLDGLHSGLQNEISRLGR